MSLRAFVVVAVIAGVASLGAVAYAQDHAQFYVVDAYGGVHAGGGAPVITPATPYFGFDVAANIEYVAVGTSVASGDGYIVLDKFGGLHYGGALAADPPPGGGTPYFGFDAARSVVRRSAPSRISWASAVNQVDLNTGSATFTVLASTNITAPIDGWLHVTGTSYMACAAGGASNNLVAYLSVNVDATTDGVPLAQGLATWINCSSVGGYSQSRNRTVSIVVPVTAGPHTVNLLGRKDDVSTTTGTVRYVGRTVTAQFIAQDALGQLSLAEIGASPAGDPSSLRFLPGR